LCRSLHIIITAPPELSKKVVKTRFLKFFLQKPQKPKNPNFVFFRFLKRKTLKIQILDSLSQQKIVAFQSN